MRVETVVENQEYISERIRTRRVGTKAVVTHEGQKQSLKPHVIMGEISELFHVYKGVISETRCTKDDDQEMKEAVIGMIARIENATLPPDDPISVSEIQRLIRANEKEAAIKALESFPERLEAEYDIARVDTVIRQIMGIALEYFDTPTAIKNFNHYYKTAKRYGTRKR